MNILVPDSWLREYLKTKATPSQIKEYLSLCGPSIERVNTVGKETIYEVEVTSNRPDSMSIVGIAREAAAILPRFGIRAELVNDPYKIKVKSQKSKVKSEKKLNITTDLRLNPRFTAVVIDNVKVGPSPTWLRQKLEATGGRCLNNVIDITNYLMRAYGQPVHAFDYDEVRPRRNGVPTMTLRSSRKGEKLTTLDGKTHILPGDDIVIEDGSGRLIDLCGIIGAQNSSIKASTKTVVLFMQTYDPAHIRRTMMTLSHRTEAGSLFEKGLDSELVLPTVIKGVELMEELTGGQVASSLYDLYPQPYQPYSVTVKRDKVNSYLGTELSDKELKNILESLGLTTAVTKEAITVTVPSFRQDITLDVDIIEEIARLWGYHRLGPKLPDTEPPLTLPDPVFGWEEEIKVRLRDWGYTELYTYSMISEELMDLFGLDKTRAYKISNPLSSEWVYLRPTLWPSMLMTIKQNLRQRQTLQLFELSHVYLYQEGQLPREVPVLLVAWTGRKLREAKGLAEAIFSLFGLELPSPPKNLLKLHNWDDKLRILLGEAGSVSEVNQELLAKLGINEPVTIFWVHFDYLVKNVRGAKSYQPIPKYPPIVEDLAFVVPARFEIGPLIKALKAAHPLVNEVSLLDTYENARTLHITYLSPARNLTNEDIKPVREKLVKLAEEKFGVSLKTLS